MLNHLSKLNPADNQLIHEKCTDNFSLAVCEFDDFEELYRDTYVFDGVIGLLEIHEPDSSGTFKIKNNEITCYCKSLFSKKYCFIAIIIITDSFFPLKYFYTFL